MTPCIVLVVRLSPSLYMLLTIKSSVRRGWVTVNLTEGDTVVLETIQASRGGIAHVEFIRTRLDGRRAWTALLGLRKIAMEELG